MSSRRTSCGHPVKLEITKRTRGENENVYINRCIVLEDGGDEYDSAARNALARFS
jgi:hypothetical protein